MVMVMIRNNLQLFDDSTQWWSISWYQENTEEKLQSSKVFWSYNEMPPLLLWTTLWPIFILESLWQLRDVMIELWHPYFDDNDGDEEDSDDDEEDDDVNH